MPLPITTLLIFYGSFILVFLVGYYMFSVFYSRQSQVYVSKLLAQTEELKPVVIKNIRMRYWKTQGYRHGMYPYSSCDLYLFDNCLAVLHRQDFISRIIYPPEFITPDYSAVYNTFGHYDVYKPVKIIFNRFVKGQIDLKLSDFNSKTIVIDITLKGLTDEQSQQLEKIKSWA